MALRCVLERVGRIGYNNHLKTKIEGGIITHQDPKGFDLDDEPDIDRTEILFGGIERFCGPLDDPLPIEAASMAVELHNKQQNSDLEFVRVVKANRQWVAGVIWYITFEATDNAGVKNTYQARVYCTIENEWGLEVFRLAPGSPSNLVVKQGDQDEVGEGALKQLLN
ncbi:cysteine proteinase inhibitor 3-like [Cornus florida]|uniref:cysteine proteinase inhibitor 3-like n=1 Tax=Cornus florida TaxID=4283 RepID=UPI0028983129|nr:cysteine proteinase inhibitor 3-like [Cornus florida]